jgi:ketosteroid isomerase-like protein
MLGAAKESKADPADWIAFQEKLDAAELEFARGRPTVFKELWSHADDVSLIGALGGKIEKGWSNVGARLDAASAAYAEGTRSRSVLNSVVTDSLALLVQNETIEAKIKGAERSAQHLRATMVFRKEGGEWKIIHRHADTLVTGLVRR